jgi:hypothetical protein
MYVYVNINSLIKCIQIKTNQGMLTYLIYYLKWVLRTSSISCNCSIIQRILASCANVATLETIYVTNRNTRRCSGFYKKWRNSRNKLWHYIKITVICKSVHHRRTSPRYSLDKRLGGPQNRSGQCGKRNIWLCRESNSGCPARSPSRRHGHRSDKNGVYPTSHLFFTWFLSLIASSMRACS